MNEEYTASELNRYPVGEGRIVDDGHSTMSDTERTLTIGSDTDFPFDPVRNGEVVLFSINLAKTCEAFDIPYDSSFQQGARSLSSGKYVAVVDKASFFPQNEWCTCDLIMISQGLPRCREDKLDDPSMCVPVYPETSHPLGRQPVRLKEGRTLPWDHCYKSTVMRTRAVVTTTNVEEHLKATSITDDSIGDLMGFWRYQIEDRRRSNILAELFDFDDEKELAEGQGRPPLYCKYSSSRTARESVFGSEDDLRLSTIRGPSTCHEFQGMINMFKQPPRKLHVDVWYDLESIAKPSDPCDFFKERAHVYQLLKEAQDRKVSVQLSPRRCCSEAMLNSAWLALHESEADDLSDCAKSDVSSLPPGLPLPSYLRGRSAKAKVQHVVTSVASSLRRAPPRFAAWVKRSGRYHRNLS